MEENVPHGLPGRRSVLWASPASLMNGPSSGDKVDLAGAGPIRERDKRKSQAAGGPEAALKRGSGRGDRGKLAEAEVG
jgi:hypothetical protein